MSRYLMFAMAVSLLSGCATTQTIRGEYADPEVIEILSERFSENDLQLIANQMAASLAQAPHFAKLTTPPRLLVGKIANRTGEPIDTDMLAERIQVALVKSGRFELFDERTRTALAKEYEYQTSGYVDPRHAKMPGSQSAADYVLIGSLSAIVQANGSDKTTYYKMSMSVSELASGIIRWADDKEIRKKYELSGISPRTSKALRGVSIGVGISGMVAGTGLLIAGLTGVGERVQPVNAELLLAGGGAMFGGLIAAFLIPRLIPEGNPQLATLQLYPQCGGAGLSLGFSF
ncbi:MAG TPA: penicillin-binding protein activator LpoB [Myxococcales bacterium]|jgi:hypothetical protein|nr:penicillin-binding protein activator LpoB [Myxococcales bacterium]